MATGRIIKNGNGFERVALSEEEEEGILEQLRERNLETYKKCFIDAKHLVLESPAVCTPGEMYAVATVASALFEKQGISSFTALAEKLNERVFHTKEYAKALEV